MRSIFLQISWLVAGAYLGIAVEAMAEHPIEVQQLTAEGNYFKALSLYERIPRRQVSSEVQESAGRSAWGLGLSKSAAEHFDAVLRDETLSEAKKAKILYMRGVIELQELRPRVAILFAERATELLPDPTKLRGAIYLLWGDAFKELGQYGAAKKKYEQALDEVAHELQADTHFRLARAERHLGNGKQAMEHFRKVPQSHERAASAIRELAELSVEFEDYQSAKFWLTKGRELYSDDFLDSWVDYALGKAAVAEGDYAELRRIRKYAQNKYPPSDGWVSLLEAIAEEAEWNKEKN